MPRLLILFVLILAPFAAMADETTLTCDYAYYGAPMAKIILYFDEMGKLKDSAKITMGGAGNPHWESITEVDRANGETLHAWFSKDTSNEVEFVLYDQPQKLGRTKIVNHQMPMAKDIWGDCKN